MNRSVRTIAVGWEYEVPLEEVQAARDSDRERLEAFFFAPAESLTDNDVARYLVRTAHPTTRYLRADVTELTVRLRSA